MDLKELIESLAGKDIFSEDQKKQFVEKLEELIDTRAKAKLEVLKEDVEVATAKKYENELKEMEDHCIETVKEAKIKLEEDATKSAKKHAETVLSDINVWKEGIVEKLDSYLDTQLEKIIPEGLKEAQAELAIYKPIVEATMKAFKVNFVDVDQEGYDALKEARNDIERKDDEINKLQEQMVNLESDKKKNTKESKINELCEGLTEDQTSRAHKILEGYDVDELDTKFMEVKDIVMEDVDNTSDDDNGAGSAISEESVIVDDTIEDKKDDKKTLTEMDEYRAEFDKGSLG